MSIMALAPAREPQRIPARHSARSPRPAAGASVPLTLQRKAACSCGGGCPRCQSRQEHRLPAELGIQAKLNVGAVDDPLEREADQVAERVMRMPERPHGNQHLFPSPDTPAVTRRALRKQDGETTDGGSDVPAIVHQALATTGQPLGSEALAFFEPRFERSFADVRVHTGALAAESAQAIGAQAYTVGSDVVFGGNEYGNDNAARQLLAHELTHVVQQGHDVAQRTTIRRQTLGAGCAAHQSALEEAWAEGRRLASATIATLENTLESIGLNVAPSPIVATALRNAFGDVGLQPGGITFLPELIRRYRLILGGFTSGKTLRCDPQSLQGRQNECDWRSAFVIVGDTTNLFLCPAFFAADVTLTSRGLTLLHEMAHSVLRIAHTGIPERTYPEAFFDCQLALGLEWDDAKRNAFAFDRLADCLHGERPSSQVETAGPPARAATTDPRWSVSALAGADVTPNAYRFASALSGRVSLRTGEFVVFNPVIGFNLLYLPSSDSNPSHLVAATAELGLRIQQPLEGFYFDVAAGGYAGFDVDPARPSPTEFTGGPTAAAGFGWRFRRLEIGPEVRALVPEGEFDRTQVLVFGRAALRFEGP